MLRGSFVLLVALCAVFSFIPQTGQAGQLLGWHLSYDPVGSDSVAITCDALSFCGGIDFVSQSPDSVAPMPSSLKVYMWCGTQSVLDSIVLPFTAEQEVSSFCDSTFSLSSTCGANNSWQNGLTGIMRSTYRLVIDTGMLSGAGCAEIRWVTEAIDRTSSSTYGGNPSGVTDLLWNRGGFEANHSVQWSHFSQFPIYSNGEEVNMNLGAFDRDADSLVWSLDTLRTSWSSSGGFNNVTYNTGYSAQAPMLSNLGIDVETGRLSFEASAPTAGQIYHYVVSVRVEEYERGSGVLKGSLQRNIPVLIRSNAASSFKPTMTQGILTGGPNTDSVSFQLCGYQTFGFELLFEDLDTLGNLSGDSLIVESNFDEVFPGASFTWTGGSQPLISFEQNNSAFIPVGVYYVTVMVRNSACPVQRIGSVVLRITSVGPTYLGPDLTLCAGDSVRLNASVGDTFYWASLYGDPILVGTNFSCSSCQKPWVSPSQTTAYVVSSNLSAVCGNTDTIIITVVQPQTLSLSTAFGGSIDSVTYCSSDPVDSVVASLLGGVYTGLGITDSTMGLFDPSSVNAPQDSMIVSTIVYQSTGVCQNTAEIDLTVIGPPDASIQPAGPFQDTAAAVQLQYSGASPAFWYSGDTNNPTPTGIFDPSAFEGPDSIWVFLVGNNLGCTSLDSMLIHILDSEVGIQEGENLRLNLFPNPADASINVRVAQAQLQLSVYDLVGRLVYAEFIEGSTKINTETWNAGVYLFQFTGGGLHKTERIVVK